MKKGYQEGEVKRTGARAIEDLGFGKEADATQQYFDLLGDEESKTFLQQYQSASRLQQFRDSGETPAGVAPNTARPNLVRPPTSTRAPMGSSLELARKQQSGAISIDEQRRMRDQLLNPKTPDARRPAPTPAKPVAPKSVITASARPGTTILQRAASRGAARKATTTR
jgi:hypothetical protein